MKRRRPLEISLMAFALLALGQTAHAGAFAYVANSGGGVDGDSIGAYTVDQKTGTLTPIAGSPFAAGDDANWVIVHPNGKFLYETNENDDTIGAYSIDKKTWR